jgi:2-haloacid dehalogenase
MPTRWISFDCFGTLVDWNTGFFAMLEPLAGNRTRELVAAYHRFERLLERKRPHQLYRDILTASLLEGAREIGLELSPTQASLLPQRWSSLPVFDDVENALASLRAEGWKLAVLTNCDDDLFAQTQKAFREPFDLVITAEQVRDYKPSLRHFQEFSRVTGVGHANWIHVACSWYHDITPAREMGIRRIWVDRDLTGDDPAAASLRLLGTEKLCEAIKQLFGEVRQ